MNEIDLRRDPVFQQALKDYVERNGRLEIEITPVVSHYTTILRMDPQNGPSVGKQAP